MAKKGKSKPPIEKCISAESIRLVDRDGKERMRLHAGSSISGIQILGPSGLPLIELQVTSDGEATLRVANTNCSTAISIGSNQNGNGITVHNHDGLPSTSIGIDHLDDDASGPSGGYLIVRDFKYQNHAIIRPVTE